MTITEYAIVRSQMEILEDMVSGKVPVTVSSFMELHDYVDANEYGGLCEDLWWCLPEDATDKQIADNDGFYLIGSHLDLANTVQSAVNQWLKEYPVTIAIAELIRHRRLQMFGLLNR
jgi:hypothetical protein